jgi:anti-sigma B factor antagonist
MDDDTPEPDLLEVEISRERGATVLAVSGELDAASTPDLQLPLDEALASSEAIVLDLSGCEFVDSTGLHAIIDAREDLRDRGGRFAVCCVLRGPVARVIEVALPGVIEIHPDRDAALDAVGE